jgi:hypothetical protein
MSETNSEPNLQQYAEAVIISGPRKGEFITVPEDFISGVDEELSPEIAAALDGLIADAKRLAKSAQAVSAEMDDLLRILKEANQSYESD